MSEVYDYGPGMPVFERKLEDFLAPKSEKQIKALVARKRGGGADLVRVREMVKGSIIASYSIDKSPSSTHKAKLVAEGLLLGLDVACYKMGGLKKKSFLESVQEQVLKEHGIFKPGATEIVLPANSRDIIMPDNARRVIPEHLQRDNERLVRSLGCMALLHDSFNDRYTTPSMREYGRYAALGLSAFSRNVWEGLKTDIDSSDRPRPGLHDRDAGWVKTSYTRVGRRSRTNRGSLTWQVVNYTGKDSLGLQALKETGSTPADVFPDEFNIDND